MGQKPSQNSKANEVATPATIDAARRAARQAGGASYVPDRKLRAVARNTVPPAPAQLDAAAAKAARLKAARRAKAAAKLAAGTAAIQRSSTQSSKQLRRKERAIQMDRDAAAEIRAERLLFLSTPKGKALAAADAAAVAAASQRQRDEELLLSTPAGQAAAVAAALKKKGKPVLIVPDQSHRLVLDKLGERNQR